MLSCFEFVCEMSNKSLIPVCYSQGGEFDQKSCTQCKRRAEEVDQFEQALVQNVSEALQTIQHFILEHDVSAQQYAVKIKRTRANILLASKSGCDLRSRIHEFVCSLSCTCFGFRPLYRKYTSIT